MSREPRLQALVATASDFPEAFINLIELPRETLPTAALELVDFISTQIAIRTTK